MAAFMQLLPSGFSGANQRGTDGAVFAVVEGEGGAEIGGVEFPFSAHDIFVVPPWTTYRFHATGETVLFSFSDRAAQETLGFWREEVRS